MSNELLDFRYFPDGQTIFHEGDRGAEAYLVKSGSVRITRSAIKGAREINIHHANTVFGELAIIADMPRVATATAVGETYCYAISRPLFEKLVDSAGLETKSMINFLVTYIHVKLNSDRARDSDSAGVREKEKIVRYILDSHEIERVMATAEPILRVVIEGVVGYAKRNLEL